MSVKSPRAGALIATGRPASRSGGGRSRRSWTIPTRDPHPSARGPRPSAEAVASALESRAAMTSGSGRPRAGRGRRTRSRASPRAPFLRPMQGLCRARRAWLPPRRAPKRVEAARPRARTLRVAIAARAYRAGKEGRMPAVCVPCSCSTTEARPYHWTLAPATAPEGMLGRDFVAFFRTVWGFSPADGRTARAPCARAPQGSLRISGRAFSSVRVEASGSTLMHHNLRFRCMR